jgi:hypothetical protein
LTDVLIAKNSSTVHELLLRFLSVAASGDAAFFVLCPRPSRSAPSWRFALAPASVVST